MKPIPLFIACLLSIACAILYSSCEKEYSYEGGLVPGTAIYTLEGEGANCTGPMINGIYTAGIALQQSNNIILQVNVTTIGTYTLSTDKINSIQFSASGSFSVTGLQTVTLTGSGTPLAAGTFSYTPPVGLGCTFFITTNVSSPAAASFTLEGAPGSCSNFKINGTYTSGLALTGANTVEVSVNVTSIGSYAIKTPVIDGIMFSQSGSFTVTGIQKVTLVGSGTPSNTGAFTFAPYTGSSQCTFNLTVSTLSSPAGYTLASNPDGTCNGYSVPGSFYVGTPLISNNIMTVKVNVTSLGNFAISTNTVNGMTFSRTGNFITLGNQIVQLIGSGTPVDIGVFVFTPKIVGSGSGDGTACNLDVYVL